MGDLTGVEVPFNLPYMVGNELDLVREAYASGHIAGDGQFTTRCHQWLRDSVGSHAALLTHSCTAALEMAALLLKVGPGDEVIMPSYTFVSTANAFAVRGATPVFVDIRPDTLNIDEGRIEAAITPRTVAIVVVHYAGIGCEMNAICEIAARHGLEVVEDAAQGLMSTYGGRPLGGIGALGAISFHETKNISCGEGGSLQINSPRYQEPAEIIREKGTNRTLFLEGRIDKYTWVELGSSFLPSDIAAAHLWAQIEHAEEITARRLAIWDAYHHGLAELEGAGLLRRPVIPTGCQGNGHMYYILLAAEVDRTSFLFALSRRGVRAVSHYVPLHSSPAGRRFGRAADALTVTDFVASRIVRLPMWVGLEAYQERVLTAVHDAFGELVTTSR